MRARPACARPPAAHAPARLTMCGYLASLTTLVWLSLMFRYWSTECSTPVMARSFFSSTVTCGVARGGWAAPPRHRATAPRRWGPCTLGSCVPLLHAPAPCTHLLPHQRLEVAVEQHGSARATSGASGGRLWQNSRAPAPRAATGRQANVYKAPALTLLHPSSSQSSCAARDPSLRFAILHLPSCTILHARTYFTRRQHTHTGKGPLLSLLPRRRLPQAHAGRLTPCCRPWLARAPAAAAPGPAPPASAAGSVSSPRG